MLSRVVDKTRKSLTRNDQLPGTYQGTGVAATKRSSWNPLDHIGYKNKNGRIPDGSASSIHTTPTLQQAWQRASMAVRISWIVLLVCILMVWMGWRFIRYSSAGISLVCHSVSCQLDVRPVGWGKRVRIENIARDQIYAVKAVKTDKQGTFVTDQNVVLTEPYTGGGRNQKNKKNKYSKKTSTNYKGPDADGNYISYGIYFKDKPVGNRRRQQQQEEESAKQDDGSIPPVALYPALHFMDRVPNDQIVISSSSNDKQANSNSNDGSASSLRIFRIIPRQFGIKQSKRRVRTMVQKIESYIKRRRQQLTVKESAPPSWQGVLLMVFGFMGVLLTLILGQFREEPVTRGPGVRRNNSTKQQQQNRQRHSTSQDMYGRQTPARYEVSTKPAVTMASASAPATASSSSSSATYGGYRKNTTTARKRVT